ncbi:hypothetical protein [Sphingobium sp. SCG-1]|uniref:hypothetical protein n=1 Tax=Sphingobium sp. SCG-1 TaxID=2072936 RepID=UPI0011AB2F3B|nr:hypothetical protein [Sphingobium sp. SCG-1]
MVEVTCALQEIHWLMRATSTGTSESHCEKGDEDVLAHWMMIAAKLRRFGCTLGHRYLFSCPVERDAMTDLLTRYAQKPGKASYRRTATAKIAC